MCGPFYADASEYQLFWNSRSTSIHDSQSEQSISGFRNLIDATSDGNKIYFTKGGIGLYSFVVGENDVTEFFTFSDPRIYPNAIAVHGENLYVADRTSIYRSTLSNLAFQLIVENPDGYISDLVVDGVNLFWSDEDGGIFRAPISGGDRVSVVQEAESPMSITFFNDRLYWTKDGDEQIRSVNKDGTDESLVVDLDSGIPQSISIAANRIWWSDVGSKEIYSCRLDGSDLKEVSLPVFSPSSLAWVFPNTETDEIGIEPLKIKRLSVEENGIRISWNARTGSTYSVFTSEDLNFNDRPVTSLQDFEYFHPGILQITEKQFYIITED